MRLFTHPEVAQWKQKATQLESDNQRLQRKLEEAYQQIRDPNGN